MRVTENIEIDLDLTNASGARGEIVDIVLHPDEPAIEDEPVVHLKYMPAYILIRVKLSRTRANTLKGLDASIIPIEPATTSYRIKFLAVFRVTKKHLETKMQGYWWFIIK
jgi:hypothetical protein